MRPYVVKAAGKWRQCEWLPAYITSGAAARPRCDVRPFLSGRPIRGRSSQTGSQHGDLLQRRRNVSELHILGATLCNNIIAQAKPIVSSLSLFLSLSLALSLSLSIYLSIYRSIYLTIYLFIISMFYLFKGCYYLFHCIGVTSY